jgi:hypothetical protein
MHSAKPVQTKDYGASQKEMLNDVDNLGEHGSLDWPTPSSAFLANSS